MSTMLNPGLSSWHCGQMSLSALKTTIIIASYNRSFFVDLVLKYYSDQEVRPRIIIADSSSSQDDIKNIQMTVELCKCNLVVDYLFLPNHKPTQAVSKALEKCTTPYVVFTGDDDFLSVDTLLDAENFLDNHDEYFSVGGLALELHVRVEKERLITQNINYAGYIFRDVLDPTASDRIKHGLRLWNPCVFAVARTKEMRLIYSNVSQLGLENHESTFPLDEWTIVALMLATGKQHKFSNKLFLVMLRHPDVGRNRTPYPGRRRICSTLFHVSACKAINCIVDYCSAIQPGLNFEDLDATLVDLLLGYYYRPAIRRLRIVATAKRYLALYSTILLSSKKSPITTLALLPLLLRLIYLLSKRAKQTVLALPEVSTASLTRNSESCLKRQLDRILIHVNNWIFDPGTSCH